jgi:hypothetical protein
MNYNERLNKNKLISLTIYKGTMQIINTMYFKRGASSCFNMGNMVIMVVFLIRF